MKKLLFILLTICSSINAQIWTEHKLDINPINDTEIKEWYYEAINDSTQAKLVISPIFNNTILLQTSLSIGRFKITKKGITSKIVVKYYDKDGYLKDRSIDKINLGMSFTNPTRKFGIIESKKLNKYLFEKDGFVVIWYKSLINKYDIPIVVSCLNYVQE